MNLKRKGYLYFISRECKQRVYPSIFVRFLLGVFFLSSNAAYTATEAERAEESKKIMGCYARLAQDAYEDIVALGSTECSATLTDDRNNMGAWTLTETQSVSNGDIIKFYDRTSPDGKRKEITVGLRGSVTAGDWVRDAQSQIYSGAAPVDNAISNLGSSPNIEMVGTDQSFFAGFDERVQNLAPEIADRLDALDTWKNASPDREIGVKVVGHSLGAAAATIAGLYVGDRYANTSDADVEVFAYNTPNSVNESMADTYRKAVSSCDFNYHVFNNSSDVVSKLPAPGSQAVGQADQAGSLDFERNTCIYNAKYRGQTAHSGINVPSPLHPLASVLRNGVNFALAQHDINQWQDDKPNNTILGVSPPVAANWFPIAELGGPIVTPFPTRTTVSGSFKANLRALSNFNYLEPSGSGKDILAFASFPVSTTVFEFEPTTADCLRHGNSFRLRTWDGLHHVRAASGDLWANTFVDNLPGQESQFPETNVFELVNHTNQLDCVADGDLLSFRTWENMYVTNTLGSLIFANAVAVAWNTVTTKEKFLIFNTTPTPRRILSQEPPTVGGHGVNPPYEAEEANLINSNVRNVPLGYHGTGFVDFGGAGTGVEFSVDIPSGDAGNHAIMFRYANGSSNRTSNLFVDGNFQGTITFPNTGGWASWEEDVMENVNLSSGMHFIKLTGVGAGPNLDSMLVKKVQSCIETAGVYVSKTGNYVTDGLAGSEFHNITNPPAFLAQMQTTNGVDTASVRTDDITASSALISIEEEQSNDSEIAHIAEVVGYMAVSINGVLTIRDKDNNIIGEASESLFVTSAGVFRGLNNSYNNPVVVAYMTTRNNNDPAHLRVRDVTSNSFIVAVEEWKYLDGTHPTETGSYIVMEEGVHEMEDGQKFVVGSLNVSQSTAGVFTNVNFASAFQSTPIVFSQSQTFNGSDPMVTRMKDISSTGFSVLVDEEESLDRTHASEVIGYIAVEGHSKRQLCN